MVALRNNPVFFQKGLESVDRASRVSRVQSDTSHVGVSSSPASEERISFAPETPPAMAAKRVHAGLIHSGKP